MLSFTIWTKRRVWAVADMIFVTATSTQLFTLTFRAWMSELIAFVTLERFGNIQIYFNSLVDNGDMLREFGLVEGDEQCVCRDLQSPLCPHATFNLGNSLVKQIF